MSYVSTPTPVIGLELISCQGDSATPGYGQAASDQGPAPCGCGGGQRLQSVLVWQLGDSAQAATNGSCAG